LTGAGEKPQVPAKNRRGPALQRAVIRAGYFEGSYRAATVRELFRRLAVIALCLVVLAGCSKKEAAEAQPVAPVQVTTVKLDSIRRLTAADGVLFPQNQANVMPKVSAPVRKFYVNRGDHVREGQLLATLENRDLVAAAAESKGQYEQAESNFRVTSAATVPEQVITAKANVQAAQQALDAAQKLLESRTNLFREGALPRKQVDEAQVAYAQAKSQYDTALEHLRALESVGKQETIKGAAAQAEAAKGHYQAAQAQVSYSEIKSPITGVITDRPLYEGELASTGSPVVTVMDLSRVVARANIPPDQASHLKIGADATISQTGSSDEISGKVIVVSPAVDPSSTTVQVWVQSTNPGEKLKPGASVHVSIVAETLTNVVVVPAAALLPTAEGDTVLMVVGPDSVAHERKIEIGVREADKVQILSGVKPGEQVITLGGVGLEDRSKVRVEKPGEKPAAEKGGGQKGEEK
jgi:multidrug efflux pump subunit AcrA (membrane-fusion protein)